MAQYTKSQLAKFDRLAREAAGLPQVKTLGDLAREHAETAVRQIKDLATQCTDAAVRLKASQTLVELCQVDSDDSFGGDPEALEALLDQPIEKRRGAALQLFANGSITKRDLDVVLSVITGDQTAQINLLLAQNARLEKALLDITPNSADGTAPRGPGRPRKDVSALQVITAA
ncbi:hypothetical protein EJ069_10285 [Mesorhizobium sp. M2A.F.Ca.ET.043.05.1.1]|uniref:hypothetical protein n=1 Tax=Mesorhizobium sp. M2A.F.Ca.ET.043.05.1.1 TaxID=2493671 RepID=UPI000F755AD5|nr:hypothetical protein [Mesorhizobium sp. M2A.F.Ca.ET.043.05.1.1]AZO15082.1 hypothetical protein EJ069_10285 [Mesorhizobium sp. M2A.F.Ca.ET.043.05.1.1]